ncbi:dolichyl-phosphate-mannose-protein mannosyltransferase [Jatrophihabitans sp. GAS493]|uniref:glycosyltransferase family 39 protein n=1 Tax=Jatrophihabitans sp. GAS493 TaxID=1907575 RepID=UPI000BB7DB47|nr:glycosyltransferase family 39 protein [Jatrophihabitans sp. GAS493]SOD71693.1 dolichyl-phosphate-mannose-protein mannosyltransferase [Jatrophihabitans sp. GAS493]
MAPALPAVARAPVFGAMGTLAVVLTAVSNGYGYHRDELYFRMLHPGWGYLDEPPFTPLVARVFSQLSDQVWALRIPATAATVLSVYVLVLVTRELGGGRIAQSICAWGYSFAAIPLIMGHALLTSTVDLPVWPAVLLFVIRALLRAQPNWWLAAGAVVGVSMYNKLLVAVLILALVAALLLVGPRRLLWSRPVLAAAGLGLLIGLPNLVYQATHDWPQLSMGRALAADNSGDVHVLVVPFLFIMLGPPLVPIWIAGLASLFRRAEWRPLRFIAVALPVLVALVFAMGSQFYYTFGLLAVIFAVGCVPTERWAHGVRLRGTLVSAAILVNSIVSVLLGLPVIALSTLGSTPVPGINQVARDSVGWPTYVAEIAAVDAALPPADAAHTIIVASNYGEAGAVARYGARSSLPKVYSAHNQLYFQAIPPASARVVIFVGGEAAKAKRLFRSCVIASRLDDRVNVDNEEQGEPIAVCRDPIGGWGAVWPSLKHES